MTYPESNKRWAQRIGIADNVKSMPHHLALTDPEILNMAEDAYWRANLRPLDAARPGAREVGVVEVTT